MNSTSARGPSDRPSQGQGRPGRAAPGRGDSGGADRLASELALGAGRAEDVGDLVGFPDTAVQVADRADMLRAVREKPIGAERQRERAGATFCATLVRLHGGVWRVVLTPEQFATWAREALAPDHEAAE